MLKTLSIPILSIPGKKILLSVLILGLVLNGELYAQEPADESQSKWELGVGIGGIHLPHYRGSDQSVEYAAPVPYISYSGKRLKIDREGGRFYFYKSENVIVDVSTAFSLSVNSSENRARAGMNDLDNVVEIGPRVDFKIYESEDRDLQFRLGVPVRVGYAVNFSEIKNIGLVFSPYIQVRYFTSGWETDISVGPVWANESYHDYFYQVLPQYKTATRPVYDAKAGYSGSRITLTLSKRYKDYFFGLFTRYDDLTGASFINSPLIKQRNSLIVAATFAWVFKESR